MEKEYDVCLRDLKSPCLCISLGLLFLMGGILTPIGLFGMFSSWGYLNLFTAIFAIGVACALMSIIITIYTTVIYCIRR